MTLFTITDLLNYLTNFTHFHKSCLLIIQQSYKQLHLLQDYLNENKNELILSSLKLLLSITESSGRIGQFKLMKDIHQNFHWNHKFNLKLINLRKHNKNTHFDLVKNSDIRTLYLLLNLIFISPLISTPSIISSHLSQISIHKSLFKTLHQDHYLVIQKFLQVWYLVWKDNRISKSLKLSIWDNNTLDHLLKIYQRNFDECQIDGVYHIPSKLIHHYFKLLTTNPGFGLCFKDDGWYPRKQQEINISNNNANNEEKSNNKLYNRLLLNLLKTLRIGDNELIADLALSILKACPEIQPLYWKSSSLTLEPRLSSRWVSNISFIGCAISLPTPTYSFKINDDKQYKQSPPPLNNLLESIIPSILTKSNLSKGLHPSSPKLVQHCTALALSKCLEKLNQVQNIMYEIGENLEENMSEGQWFKRRDELLNDSISRLPDSKVIINFVTSNKDVNNFNSMLFENSIRLLSQYQSVIPQSLTDNQDISKLLFSNNKSGIVLSEPNLNSFNALSQLHAIKLLKDSKVYTINSKIGNESSFFSVMKLNIETKHKQIRELTSELVNEFLSNSNLFGFNKDEVNIWLKSGLNNLEILKFIDNSLQRCSKSYRKYFEKFNNEIDNTKSISPLIYTFLEQIQYQIEKELVNDNELSVLIKYTRNLIIGLFSKQQSGEFELMNKLVKWLFSICNESKSSVGQNTKTQLNIFNNQINNINTTINDAKCDNNDVNLNKLDEWILEADPKNQNIFAFESFNDIESGYTSHFDLLLPHITKEAFDNFYMNRFIKRCALNYYNYSNATQLLCHKLNDENIRSDVMLLMIDLIRGTNEDYENKMNIIIKILQSPVMFSKMFDSQNVNEKLSNSLLLFTKEIDNLRRNERFYKVYGNQLIGLIDNYTLQARKQLSKDNWMVCLFYFHCY